MKKIIANALASISIGMFPSISLASFPENDLEKWDNGNTWNITEQEFWEMIDLVYGIYKPIFNELKLDNGEGVSWWFEADWNSKIHNMYASKVKVYPYGWNKWIIKVHGGIARMVQMTKEGFLLGLCHEIGHMVGGYPLMDYTEYSTEGESDYYATHVCARKVFSAWAKKYNLKKVGATVEICEKNFDTQKEKDVCVYSVFGSKSLADVFYIANKQTRSPEIDTPDNYVVKLTYQLHTPAQCRLDTFIAGIMCDKSWDDKRIPTERNAVCRNRPTCWYFNNLNSPPPVTKKGKSKT
jgi:hypothetical protein